MTLTTGPNLGLLINGAKGEAHYDALMRFFRGLDTLVQPRVSSRVLALPTTGLVDGLLVVYLGADTNKDKLVRYSSVLTAWEYFTPKPGWSITVLDEQDGNGQFKVYQYTGSEWVEKLTAGGLTLEDGDARYERLVKHNLSATRDPGPEDDVSEGYSVLSRWVNTTTKESFLALDVMGGAAVWQQTTLTIDELGTAALATVGVLDENVPTVSVVKNLLANMAVFTAGSAVAGGVKGLVPAPPQSEVLRYLRSDGVWAFFEIPEGTELSKGQNIGGVEGAHGVYFQTVGNTLQFKSLISANERLKISSTEGNVVLEVPPFEASASLENVGSGAPIYAGTVDGKEQLRTITAGSNVSVSLDGDAIVISASGGGGPVDPDDNGTIGFATIFAQKRVDGVPQWVAPDDFMVDDNLKWPGLGPSLRHVVEHEITQRLSAPNEAYTGAFVHLPRGAGFSEFMVVVPTVFDEDRETATFKLVAGSSSNPELEEVFATFDNSEFFERTVTLNYDQGFDRIGVVTSSGKDLLRASIMVKALDPTLGEFLPVLAPRPRTGQELLVSPVGLLVPMVALFDSDDNSYRYYSEAAVFNKGGGTRLTYYQDLETGSDYFEFYTGLTNLTARGFGFRVNVATSSLDVSVELTDLATVDGYNDQKLYAGASFHTGSFENLHVDWASSEFAFESGNPQTHLMSVGGEYDYIGVLGEAAIGSLASASLFVGEWVDAVAGYETLGAAILLGEAEGDGSSWPKLIDEVFVTEGDEWSVLDLRGRPSGYAEVDLWTNYISVLLSEPLDGRIKTYELFFDYYDFFFVRIAPEWRLLTSVLYQEDPDTSSYILRMEGGKGKMTLACVGNNVYLSWESLLSDKQGVGEIKILPINANRPSDGLLTGRAYPRADYSDLYYAVTGGYAYYARGEGWMAVDSDLPPVNGSAIVVPVPGGYEGQWLVAPYSSGVLRSDDDGSTWITVLERPSQGFLGIAVDLSNNSVGVVSEIGDFWYSEDAGETFVQKTNTSVNYSGYLVMTSGAILHFGERIVRRSVDAGETWQEVSQDPIDPKYGTMARLASSGDVVLFALPHYAGGLLNRSLDSGASWTAVPMPFDPSSLAVNGQTIVSVGSQEEDGVRSTVLAVSDDLGDTWRFAFLPENYGQPHQCVYAQKFVTAFAGYSEILYFDVDPVAMTITPVGAATGATHYGPFAGGGDGSALALVERGGYVGDQWTQVVDVVRNLVDGNNAFIVPDYPTAKGYVAYISSGVDSDATAPS